MPKVIYAVIALTKSEAQEIIDNAEEKEIDDRIVKWLKGNKDRIYGDKAEDWKPFNGQKIQQLIENSSNSFANQTPLTCDFGITSSDTTQLLKIQIYFIDVFALILDRYRELARDLDLHLYKGKAGSCCIIIYHRLDEDVFEQLEKIYQSRWKHVTKGYKEGFLHRVAMRADDLLNFKNYFRIKFSEEDNPNPVTSAGADKHPSLSMKGRLSQF